MKLSGSVIKDMRLLIVDINVVLSALVSHGDSSRVFILNAQKNKFRLISPQFFLIEAGKHTTEIAERSALSLEEALKDVEFIMKQITLVSEDEYKDKENEAKQILKGHEKDVPYLALSLKYDCNIFSGDKIFKQFCPERVKTPREILEELDKI